MKKILSPLNQWLALALILLITGVSAQDIEKFKGKLVVGKTESVIYYYGEESGDVAAFCFTNQSAVGRRILAKCRNGKQCEFEGTLDYEKGCRTKGSFSAQAKILTLKSARAVSK